MKFKLIKISLLSLILVFVVNCKEVNSEKSSEEIKPKDSLITINVEQQSLGDSISGIRKIKDIIIYKDSMFFSTFPSVITRPDGEIFVAFRKAPDRKIFKEKGNRHIDPNSYLVMVQSCDNGETWTKNSKLIYAHPFGGSQDPCLLQLKNGKLLCASYGWAFLNQEGLSKVKQPFVQSGEGTFLGGYLTRSLDGGITWGDAIYPTYIKPEIMNDAFGNPLPVYNRGALYEAHDGRVLWIVAAHDSFDKTSNHLMESRDEGLTWSYVSPVAIDTKVSFDEASIIETPKGDLVGFLRTANFDGQAVISRSTDGGKTFKWESMGFQGHPLHAMRLKDNRVLLTYGYRHKPYGIRARILNAECTDFATAPEMILRDDGGTTDLGYPWSTQINENRVLVVYYFNQANGTRYIAGTILEI